MIHKTLLVLMLCLLCSTAVVAEYYAVLLNTEYDFDHYEIYCKLYDHELQLTSFWFLLATTTDTTFTDSSFAPHNGSDADTAWYKIAAIGLADLSSDCSNVVSAPGEIRPAGEDPFGFITCVNEFILGNNYPNPFNSVTTIDFTLPEAAFVELKVFDICGREIAALADE
ncbi:MAG: hypothetical protein ABH878_10580, partial [bacterium]